VAAAAAAGKKDDDETVVVTEEVLTPPDAVVVETERTVVEGNDPDLGTTQGRTGHVDRGDTLK
jgi:hypothetical protein